MNVFAGFWVDGAVRKPDERHGDSEGEVVVKVKPNGADLYLEQHQDITGGYYWLDTTPRELLTPEELFSLVRVIWPKCENVFNSGIDASVAWQVQLDDANEHTPIAWCDLRQYPPPIEPQWIRVTRENVGQYLFRECRTQRNDITYAGRVVGWCLEDDCCLVESDYKTDWPVLQWDVVEVQNAPTP